MTATTQIPTFRNGFPCSIVSIDPLNVRRMANAFHTGAQINVTYTNLDGVTQSRVCYVESIYEHLLYATIKHRDFGIRTVFFERIVGVK